MTATRLDFYHGQISFTVASNNLAVVRLRIALQLHLDAVGAFNYVLIRHHVAFRVNDHAGAKSAFRPASIRTALTTAAAKKAVKEVIKWAVIVLIVGSLRPAAPAWRLRRPRVRL